jgi:hypothetical protein
MTQRRPASFRHSFTQRPEDIYLYAAPTGRHRLLDHESVAHAGFGAQVARAGRVGLQLAARPQRGLIRALRQITPFRLPLWRLNRRLQRVRSCEVECDCGPKSGSAELIE